MISLKHELHKFLACPLDKKSPLLLHVLDDSSSEIVSGVFRCGECTRFYPIIDGIPILLPDHLRNQSQETNFLIKWKNKLPDEIIYQSLPFNIKPED